MEIEYFGVNTIRLSAKNARFIVDDTLAKNGKKSITKSDDVSIQTDTAIPVAGGSRLLLNAPGEFEVGDVSIKAIAARGARDEANQKTATIFRFDSSDGSVVVAGHIHPDLTEDQLEQVGHVDILIVPVGGYGFTLDPEGALNVIKKLSPSVVIPTYYKAEGLTTEMPQTTLDEALSQLAMTADEPKNSLKLKGLDLSGDQAKLIVLDIRS